MQANAEDQNQALAASTAPPDIFRKLFTAIWKRNAEFTINGLHAGDPYTLLIGLAGQWNATHSSSSTFTFQPDGGANLVQRLLHGDFDGQERPPLTINVAPIPKKVIPLSGGDPTTDPGVLAPALYWATGLSMSFNDPGLAAAVAAVRANGVDPGRWKSLTAAQQKLVTLAGFTVRKNVIPVGGAGAVTTDPGVLAPAVFYATGTKFALSDPALAAAVTALRVTGVDPARWATLNASQQALVKLAGIPAPIVVASTATPSTAAPSPAGWWVLGSLGAAAVVAAAARWLR